MNLEQEVGKQIGIGFTYPEILENLKDKSFAEADIEAAYTKMVKEVPSGNESEGWNFKTILSVVVVIIAIIRIIMRLSRNSY